MQVRKSLNLAKSMFNDFCNMGIRMLLSNEYDNMKHLRSAQQCVGTPLVCNEKGLIRV
jgi:hypothetical protein